MVEADEDVVLKAAFDDRVYVFEPFPVACHLVDFPGSNCPDVPIGGARPASARAGVLDDASKGVNLADKAVDGGLSLEV